MVLVHVLERQVGDDVGGFRRRQQRDAGSVAVEAEVAVVRDDVDGRVPGDGDEGRRAGAGVVDGRDVAAVEADAGAAAEQREVGWVGRGHEHRCDELLARRCGGVGFLLLDIEVVGAEEEAALAVVTEWFAVDLAGEVVMHGCEAAFVAECYALPDALFGCDEVGKALADLAEADKGRSVFDGEVHEDLGEDFLGDGGDGTWWCRRELGWWFLALDG